MRLFDDVIYIRNISIKLPLICSNIFILNGWWWVCSMASSRWLIYRFGVLYWISCDSRFGRSISPCVVSVVGFIFCESAHNMKRTQFDWMRKTKTIFCALNICCVLRYRMAVSLQSLSFAPHHAISISHIVVGRWVCVSAYIWAIRRSLNFS